MQCPHTQTDVFGVPILFGIRVEAKIFLADLDGFSHRDRHLEQQETEKIESEVRDVDRIRITKCVRMLPRVAFWRVIKALRSNINRYFSPQPAAPHL
jgi:hypothetical protein